MFIGNCVATYTTYRWFILNETVRGLPLPVHTYIAFSVSAIQQQQQRSPGERLM